MSIFNNSQKLILNKIPTILLMKIITWTVQTPRTIPKLVTPNISQWKETLSQKLGFLKKTNCIYAFDQSPTKHKYFFLQNWFIFLISDHKSENVRSSVFLIRSNARSQILDHKFFKVKLEKRHNSYKIVKFIILMVL